MQSWRSHYRRTIALGLPVVGAQLTQLAINTTDVLMVGQLGAVPLAAIVLATQSFFVIFMFGTGLGMAVMPMAAEAVGQEDDTALRRATRMGLWIAMFYGLIMVLPLWFLEPILLILGQDAEVAALAGDYIQIALWGLIPALLFTTLRSTLTAVEHAAILLWATLAGTVLNAVIDYVLIFGAWGAPELGVKGAAWASIGSGTLILLIVGIYSVTAPRLKALELYVRIWRADWAKFFEIIRLGLPISMTIIAEVSLFVAASIMMGWFGPVVLAAHGIALQIASVTFMVPLGLSNVGTVRVGQAFGRKDNENLKRAGASVTILAIGFACFSAICFWLFPEPLIRLFLDMEKTESREILQIAIPFLYLAAAFQIVDSAQAIAAGNLRGLKDTRVPMLLAVFSYWVIGMGIAYGLSQYTALEGIGIWTGLALGLATAAIALNYRFWRLV